MRLHNVLFLSAIHTMVMFAALVPPSAIAAESRNRPAQVRQVEGSDIPQITLLETAAKRLGVKTTVMREEAVKRWIVLPGVVENVGSPRPDSGELRPSAGNPGTNAAPVWIKVPIEGRAAAAARKIFLVRPVGLSIDAEDDDDNSFEDAEDDAGEFDDNEDDDNNVAMVVPVGASGGTRSLIARSLTVSSDLAAAGRYFELAGAASSLQPGQRVFVRISEPDSSKVAKIIPYSALIYDVAGNCWVYVNPEPLVFMRSRVVVEHIQGSFVILRDGPPAGTRIVSVGAAELMGIEQKVGN